MLTMGGTARELANRILVETGIVLEDDISLSSSLLK